MRFFRVIESVHAALRELVMIRLGQPNESASAPWGEHGDFTAGGYVYIAFGRYHVQRFANLIDELIDTPGVEEVTLEAYSAANISEEEL